MSIVQFHAVVNLRVLCYVNSLHSDHTAHMVQAQTPSSCRRFVGLTHQEPAAGPALLELLDGVSSLPLVGETALNVSFMPGPISSLWCNSLSPDPTQVTPFVLSLSDLV